MDVLEEERLAFAEELEEVALQLSLQDPALPVAERSQQVNEEYERLAMAAEMFALPEVSTLISWSQASLDTSASAGLLENGRYFNWLELTALTFREPEELSHLPLLMAELTDVSWPHALPPEQLQAFLLSLRPEESAGAEVETVDGVDSDNPLRFSADIHPELLAAYMEETPNHVTEAARLMRLLANGEANDEQYKHASRLAHTLKGSSSVVGVEPIAGFTHRLEDLLEYPLATIARTEGLDDTLEASADCLEAMFENLQAGSGLPDEYPELNQQLTEWLGQLETAQDDEAAEFEDLPDLKPLTELPDFIQATTEATDDSGDAVIPQSVEKATSLKLSEDRIQDMLSQTGELITSTSLIAEVLQHTRNLGAQLYQQDEQIRQRLDELEGLVDQQKHRGLLHGANSNNQSAALSGQPGDADSLEIESYSDLYSTTSLLTEAAADSREMAHELQNNIRKLTDTLYQQQRVQRRLSESVLGLRLTPINELVPRMERIVRETARKTGKQVDIEITGQDLQADTDIVKGLAEPLLHLLRNAVDHGIETGEERLAGDKPEGGTIKLHFSQAGNHITLLVEDDGKGMEPQQIRQRALERGLLSERQELSDEALLRLVLLPGFSTRDEVSEVSGRGVGMDVVQSAIEKLRGTLKIASTPGQGTIFTLTLPQTLIATHALIVRAGGNHLAIPAGNVEQLLYVSADESIMDEQGWRIETDRYQLPVLKLADVLHWPSEPVVEAASYTLLIVRSETNAFALYVEEILPSRDIVINNLAPWLNSIHSVQGACILANGVVAPVMDMIRLLHELESGALTPRSGDQGEVLPEAPTSTILVVDDSLSNRKSMRLMLEPMGYVVRTAVDGMDALELMNSLDVDLVLTDLEMPRMNGLELTQAIRIWPEMKHLPIVMVTSRGTQKHRKLAADAGTDGYLTKPVQTDLLEQEVQKLLGTQMNNKTVQAINQNALKQAGDNKEGATAHD